MTASARGSTRWIAMSVAMIATFMSALDGSVVNVALPVIGHELGRDVGAMQWVVTGYLLSISSLLLVFGRLADALGYGWFIGIGFLVFGLSSAGCGLAGSEEMLVAMRVVQGIGASMLMASGPALVTTSFPPEERGRALGLQATATYLGLSLGPSIGGWITSAWGWHGVFLVNVPIAAAGIALNFLALHPARAGTSRHFDFLGAALFATGLTAILLGLGFSRNAGWDDPRVFVLIPAGPLILAAFLYRQLRAPEPLLPLGLFRDAAFTGGVGAAYLQYLVIFVAIFLVPFYLQGVHGLSPRAAGVVLTAQPLVMVFLTAPAGWLSDRIGTRVPSTIGMLVIAASAFLLTRMGATTALWRIVASLGVLGVGVGLFTTPNNSAIMGAAPRERQGVASGLLAAARNVGMVSGVATGANLLALWQGRLAAAGVPAPDAFLGAFRRAHLVAALLAIAGAGLCLFRPAARASGAAGARK